ncbi:MAG: divalent-cation tolerance protein CutA [Pyrinomonadaceae bacterium]
MNDLLIVFTTLPDLNAAEELARRIVEARLAACVQVLPAMTSVYLWQGDVQREAEHLLLIKTSAASYPRLEEFITENHSYSVPEIVAVQADKVSAAYLSWLKSSLDTSEAPN